jgi:predicted transcriptional regulator
LAEREAVNFKVTGSSPVGAAIKKEEMMTTQLQDAILTELVSHGPQTTAELAQVLNRKPRAVSNSLSFLRGYGYVSDGTAYTEHPDGYSFAETPNPIRWSII